MRVVERGGSPIVLHLLDYFEIQRVHFVTIRTTLYVHDSMVACDHGILDGKDAAAFIRVFFDRVFHHRIPEFARNIQHLPPSSRRPCLQYIVRK
jgi:hypothetical protein